MGKSAGIRVFVDARMLAENYLFEKRIFLPIMFGNFELRP
jgi:hypothetical protein